MGDNKAFCTKCNRELKLKDRIIIKSYISFNKKIIRSSCCSAVIRYEED